jgi:hypothetical protein
VQAAPGSEHGSFRALSMPVLLTLKRTGRINQPSVTGYSVTMPKYATGAAAVSSSCSTLVRCKLHITPCFPRSFCSIGRVCPPVNSRFYSKDGNEKTSEKLDHICDLPRQFALLLAWSPEAILTRRNPIASPHWIERRRVTVSP